ncbi:MAG: YegS/Rv2252/BmrU family lipid kinase [Coriobacteriia bacterium]|nr:YegS/Rv2252/BmrU family lipid kinase [Coriobacteriia bacterium]
MHLIIVNPAANSGRAAELIPLVEQCFAQAQLPYRLVLSESAGHPEAIARKEATADTCAIIAVGGDGTVSEAINGIMSLDAGQRPALGIISAGSGNDAARGFGISSNPKAAIDVVLDTHSKTFDIGKVNDRYFASSFSIGLDAMVVEQTLKYKATKGWTGSRLYYTSLLKIITSRLQAVELAINYTDDNGSTEPVNVQVLLCAITNGQTYGGGIPINPGAHPSNGQLALAWIDSMNVLETLTRLPLITSGKHINLKVYNRKEITSATVQSTNGTKLPAQADGELFYDCSFEICAHAAKLKVLTPSSTL